MAMRTCPKCSCSRGAALSQPIEPGDYFACAGCGSILRLGSDSLPVLVSEKEIERLDEATTAQLQVLQFAVRTQHAANEKRRQAENN